MRIIRIILIASAISLTITSCENFGIAGQGGVKGSKAKEEILSIVIRNDIIYCTSFEFFGPFSSSNSSPSIPVSSIVYYVMIDGTVVPSLAGISDSEHYTRQSLDDCKRKLLLRGLTGIMTLGNWLGAIRCNLKKVSPVIQIGNTGI